MNLRYRYGEYGESMFILHLELPKKDPVAVPRQEIVRIQLTSSIIAKFV